jgi:hypothetical protein
MRPVAPRDWKESLSNHFRQKGAASSQSWRMTSLGSGEGAGFVLKLHLVRGDAEMGLTSELEEQGSLCEAEAGLYDEERRENIKIR